MGTMKAEIYMDRIPRTASNFIDLCQSGFYDDLHFREPMLLASPPEAGSACGNGR